ncbi:MAG: hypothetical protein NTZ67_02055 [Gammaproteobacteria bacterium]|nr:hypothetical protein [Gammaproteobacteria bacterium]
MNIAHITYILGENKLSIQEILDSGEITGVDAMIFEKIMGLAYVKRHFAKTPSDQISDVVSQLFAEYPADRDAIKYVIYSHTSEYAFPLGDYTLRNILLALKISNAFCFETTLYKCVGAFNALKLANSLFHKIEDYQTILIVVADIAFTSILRAIPGSALLSDVATAILLKKSDAHHCLLDVKIDSYGQFSKGIWADRNEKLLFQKDYVFYLCKIIDEITKRNNILINELKYIFPHNVNKISWKQVLHTLSIPLEKIYFENIAAIGHGFGSDPFLNLKDGILNNAIYPGDYYLLVGMGLGATFSAALLQY